MNNQSDESTSCLPTGKVFKKTHSPSLASLYWEKHYFQETRDRTIETLRGTFGSAHKKDCLFNSL